MRLGTRGSPLARAQAARVAERLGTDVEIVVITTAGDRHVGELPPGNKGLWVEDIERALLDGTIDIAVHSAKDMPASPLEGVTIGAVPEREDPRDVLVGALSPGARVGTSSLRRRAQLLALDPSVNPDDIRGNVDTRLRKYDEGSYDALVLARAGLVRLGLQARADRVFEPDEMMPAPGQGTLAIECRSDDDATLRALSAIDDAELRATLDAERAFLLALDGDCHLPVAALARVTDGTVHIDGLVASLDGSRSVRGSHEGSDAAATGRALAERLLTEGADEIIAGARA